MTETVLTHDHPLDKWLSNRRKALEEWKRLPPHGLGLLVLHLVACEFVVTYRLVHSEGLDASLFGAIVRTVFFVLTVETGVLLISSSVASLFDRRARFTTTLTGLNIALLPLLLYLPISLYCWASGAPNGVRVLILLLLVLKILSDWKEVLRVNYRLSGIQTYMLGGVLGGIAYVIFIGVLVLSGFGVMVEGLTQLGLR